MQASISRPNKIHRVLISGVLSTNFRVPSPKPGSRTSLVKDTPLVHQNVHSRKLKHYYCCIYIAQRIRAGTVGVFGEQPSVLRPDPSWLVRTVFSRLPFDFFRQQDFRHLDLLLHLRPCAHTILHSWPDTKQISLLVFTHSFIASCCVCVCAVIASTTPAAADRSIQ